MHHEYFQTFINKQSYGYKYLKSLYFVKEISHFYSFHHFKEIEMMN